MSEKLSERTDDEQLDRSAVVECLQELGINVSLVDLEAWSDDDLTQILVTLVNGNGIKIRFDNDPRW